MTDNYIFFSDLLSMKNKNLSLFVWIAFSTILCLASSCSVTRINPQPYGQISLDESIIPIHPGIPGKVPFWNQNAHQFIYAPAFDYKLIEGADSYNYTIHSIDKQTHSFKSDLPTKALSAVWKDMPTGFFDLQVIALNADGDSIGLAGGGKYYKAAYFNGTYHEPVMPYDESAKIALNNLMHKDYVDYWLKHKKPDPEYFIYRYPAKIFSALIVGAISHAKLNAGTAEAAEVAEVAEAAVACSVAGCHRKGVAARWT